MNNYITTEITDQERQIITRISEGWTQKQIANELLLSEKTLEHMITSIRFRLGVKNSAHLISVCHQQGILGNNCGNHQQEGE